MDLDVVIVTYFTPPEVLERGLRCLDEAVVAAAAEVRVAIVNNGGPVTTSSSQFPNLHLICHEAEKNLGFGAAVNLGLRLADAPRVLMLNPDTEVDIAAVRVLIELLDQHASPALVSGLLVSRTGAVHLVDYAMWRFSLARPLLLVRQTRRLRERLEADSPSAVVPVPKVPGAALAARREVLMGLGPFDEELFLYGEDRELSLRAREQGVQLLVARAARVFHARESSAEVFSEIVHRARVDSSLRILSKRYGTVGRVAGWLDLMVVTLLHQVADRGRSSPICRARYRELRRWATTWGVPGRFDPAGFG